ncbi:MAG: transcription-repair coupling factor [Proteobacteria bacterium]|nr:transcription-repair coupling factor [Pseudomonadota bacterium]
MDYKIKLKNIRESCVLVKTPSDARGFLSAEVSKNFSDSDFVFVAKDDAEMELIQKQIHFFAPDFEILNFYAWDSLPFDRVSPKALISANRIKTLHRLMTRAEGKRFFIVTSVNSLLQKTIPAGQIKDLGLYLKIGSKASIPQISEFLVSKGYERRTCANSVGEFAIRGGIIDVVMQQAADLIGYRIDFLGDEVESIKVFDPITQITQEAVKSLEILPSSEVIFNKKTVENFRQKYRENFGASLDDQLYSAISENRSYPGMEHWLPFFYEENLVSFFDYLKNPITFFSEEILQLSKEREALINDYYQARIADLKIRSGTIYHPITPDLLYFSAADLEKILQKNVAIQFNKFDCEQKDRRILDLEIKPVPDFALAGRTNQKDPLELVKEFSQNSKVVIACLSESFRDRIAKILPDYGLKFPTILLPLNLGFYTSDSMLIGEQAIFGEKIIRKKSSKAASQRLIEEGLSIAQGELVVHRDHGIGRFEGIQTITAIGIKTDMIKIAYGGNETLFVPVHDIDLITRYGADNPLIQLDRLGLAAWKNRREKVRKRIKVAAEELLKIAAARHLKKAEIFAPDQNFYDEFKSRFGFVETEDQMRAIEEVEEDLAKGSPMDRLICGDVGFGKTEVAMRAAAIVVGNFSSVERSQNQENSTSPHLVSTPLNQSVSQIAIVAPTTLLVRQHYKNFSKRFDGTGVKIAQLSRLISTSEAKKIKEEIESGAIQIVIGTHALLQKNIKFKNLSLVIIDEEQHFGVAQKERLKELRNEVHVLTLSATPIPRSLQMSLTGVKDLSLIATPPLDRLAVRNFVMPYDSVIVREAVMREYNRGGRVFFVVPRIRDIEEMEPRLKILLPEIKITHAHGQMTPTELDQIMNDFVDGKIDMLLSTTIVESGIDISEANSMIIYKAEMFGLAQLYQLRGRVGRGKVRAYCYLMLDHRKKVSDESQKKLEVMQNLDSLGVGFTVATHDMDIRGSGNLLGDEQSGHVKETGVELYQQMLLETIEELKNNKDLAPSSITPNDEISIQIKLGISLLIPEEYMPDLSLRMSFYKKIAMIKDDEDAQNLADEMNDRFGKTPEEVLNLIEIAKLKHLCKKLGVEKLETIADGVALGFKNNKFRDPEKLLALIFASKNKIKLHTGQKVLFICDVSSVQNKISSAFAVMKKLENL